MLRHFVQYDAGSAKRYYRLADYLAQGETLQAALGGKAAERLGVDGSNTQEHFERLCDNLHPLSAVPLTLRHNGERRVGVDFTFDGPKGFAILEALTGDPRLRHALDAAAEETMCEMERAAAARVRKEGADGHRDTGNLVWYRAPHDTTRPVDSVPDPQRHVHYFVLNATWDPVERAWKAAELFDILRDLPYYEAAFHNRLAQKLEALGYAVARTHGGRYFEIEGVPQSAIDKYSRRLAQIEAAQAEKEAELGSPLTPAEKGQLGAKVREHKGEHLTVDALRHTWVSWLTEGESEALRGVYGRAQERAAVGWQREHPTARESLAWAAEHVFTRQSSAPATQLLAEALRYGVGGFSVGEAWAALERDGRYTADVDGRLYVAHRDVREEERRLVKLARDGRASKAPLNPDFVLPPPEPGAPDLNNQQKAAVRHLLSSRGFVTMVVGAAGVGKSTLLAKAKQGANAAGVEVLAFAPSAAASRGTLREDPHFRDAETTAMLFTSKELQARARGQVILVDEAPLLGTKETAQLLALAKDLGARLWLAGDDRQHRSVSRGTPFELLQTRAGINPAVVTEIVRQKDAKYKDVVALTREDAGAGWARLCELGWVVELPAAERYQRLAADYLEAVKPFQKKGQWQEPTSLVVAPTHAEGNRVTAAIRAGLKAQGKLGEEREFLKLTNLHLTEAERRDPASYEPGTVLQFTQNVPGHRRGERVALTGGHEAPAQHAARFQAFRPGTLKLAVGDRVRVTLNGYSVEGKRLDNGTLATVKSFDKAGNIRTDKGTLAGDFGHLASGYVTTSVSGQSRTVDRVLVAVGVESMGAANRRQLYVDLSRGRVGARFYTDDAQTMARAFQREQRQVSATELAERATAERSRRLLAARYLAVLRRAALRARDAAARLLDRQTERLPERQHEPERGLAR